MHTSHPLRPSSRTRVAGPPRSGRVLAELLLATWLLLVVGAIALRVLDRAAILATDARRLDGTTHATARVLADARAARCAAPAHAPTDVPRAVVMHTDAGPGTLAVAASFPPPPFAAGRPPIADRELAWGWPCP